mgnify:CR=1 FL=1
MPGIHTKHFKRINGRVMEIWASKVGNKLASPIWGPERGNYPYHPYS